MATSGGISGTAVAVATLGGILVYAGFQGVNPIQALRDITDGSPKPVTGHPASFSGDSSGSGGTAVSASSGTSVTSGSRSAVTAAAQQFTGDVYSQAKRRKPGFSDCSSFVDKALKQAGITPPGDPWATSGMFRLASSWRTIPASKSLPGDIAVSSHHIVLVTSAGGAGAIGQQNHKVNVRTGTVASLMGNQSYVYRTYKGYAATTEGPVLQA